MNSLDKKNIEACAALQLSGPNSDFIFQMEPGYRPSLIDNASKDSSVLPFAGSDLVLSPSQWSSHVVGIILSLFFHFSV